jgi:hypothetical protein
VAFQNAQQARVLLGPLSLSASLRSAGFTHTHDTADTTTLADTARASILTLETSQWAFDGPLDTLTTANLPYDILTDNWKAAEQPITYAPGGLTFNSPVILASAIETNISLMSPLTDSNNWSATGQTNGATDVGLSLDDGLTAITIDTTGTARDHGAATANGGVAQIHVTAFSGFTSNTTRIEHSVDGVGSWSVLATFTAATGLTSERIVVAAGTTVRRYLRVVDVKVGAGSTNRQVSFARR